MALKTDESLLIYLELNETDLPPYPTGQFLVAIFDAPEEKQIARHVTKMKIWGTKSKCARLISKKPKIDVLNPKAVCKAAAYLQDDGSVLTVKNVGAEQGFGPTLYVVLMELARKLGRKGVRPCDEPGKILNKPKLIWHRFYNGPEYKGKVLTTPVSGHHSENWLNMVYSLAPDAALLNYKLKRAKWRRYEKFWKDSNGVRVWRESAFDTAKRSVDAHVSGTNQ